MSMAARPRSKAACRVRGCGRAARVRIRGAPALEGRMQGARVRPGGAGADPGEQRHPGALHERHDARAPRLGVAHGHEVAGDVPPLQGPELSAPQAGVSSRDHLQPRERVPEAAEPREQLDLAAVEVDVPGVVFRERGDGDGAIEPVPGAPGEIADPAQDGQAPIDGGRGEPLGASGAGVVRGDVGQLVEVAPGGVRPQRADVADDVVAASGGQRRRRG